MAARDCGGSTTPHPRALWAPLRVALHSNHADWCMPWEQHRRPGPREKLETCTCVCAVVQPEESALPLLLMPPSRDFQACHCHALLPTHTRYQCVCKREAHLFSGNVNIHRGNTEDSFGCGCSGQGRGGGRGGEGLGLMVPRMWAARWHLVFRLVALGGIVLDGGLGSGPHPAGPETCSQRSEANLTFWALTWISFTRLRYRKKTIP